MCESSPEEVAAPNPGATNEGNGKAANNVSQGKTISTFFRCGTIGLEKKALKIEYESFGKAHVVYISPMGIRFLVEKTMPCDVEEVREGIDGTEVISQVGKAWRSRSGKALMIRTVQSDGEVLVPWLQFKKVVAGQIQKATVSRFGEPPKPRPRPSSGLSDGLAGGF